MVSFYLEKLIFLTIAIEIKDNNKIISTDFLSTHSSNHYCIVLLTNKGEIKILIINVEKIKKITPQKDFSSHSNSYETAKKASSSGSNLDFFLNSIESSNLVQTSSQIKSIINPFFKSYTLHRVITILISSIFLSLLHILILSSWQLETWEAQRTLSLRSPIIKYISYHILGYLALKLKKLYQISSEFLKLTLLYYTILCFL